MAKQTEYEFQISTIETIDRAMFNWLSEGMNVHTTTNKGWKKVPVIWLSSERNFHIKNDKDLRDANGVLKLPLMSVERTSMVKDLTNKGGYYAAVPENTDYKGGALTIARRVNQDKSSKYAKNALNRRPGLSGLESKFQNWNIRNYNSKVVYEHISIPLPTYVNVQYKLVLRTEYQQQMNDIMAAFYTKPNSSSVNSLFIEADGHHFELFIDGNFAQANNSSNIGNSEKTYQTTLTFRVQGYLVGADENSDKPKVVVRENAVDLVMSRERVITGDVPQYPTSTTEDQASDDDADSSD